MKNTHLSHPEDIILEQGMDGVRQIVKFFRERNGSLSVKWDGAPAIVWGLHPENGKFFVGTKSVFNKVKVKVNYTHHDIEVNHGDKPRVAAILHLCLDNLPKLHGVYQGDFIGFGGTDTYTPNTITYKFPSKTYKSIVFAAHTSYTGDSLKEMSAHFDQPFCISENSFRVKFLKKDATFTSRRSRIDYLLDIADLACNFVRFPGGKEAEQLKVKINKCIREQRDISEAGMGKRLTYLYKLIMYIKECIMEGISSVEEVECFIGDSPTSHEGYVMSNQFGTYKLVNRRQFSYANFTVQKQWDK